MQHVLQTQSPIITSSKLEAKMWNSKLYYQCHVTLDSNDNDVQKAYNYQIFLLAASSQSVVIHASE